MKNLFRLWIWTGFAILGFSLRASAEEANVWDLTGPIDPSYALNAETYPRPEYRSDEYSKGNLPDQDFTINDRKDSVRELNRYVANRDNELNLYTEDCHRTKIPGLVSFYLNRGYCLERLSVSFQEAPFQTRWSSFYRIVQTVQMAFSSPGRREVLDASVCKTLYWRAP